MSDNLKIYSLLSPSWHGSTLVSLLLSNHSRVFALGDTLPSGKLPARCGCGRNFAKCGFWQRVRQSAGNSNRGYPDTRPSLVPWDGLNQFTVLAAGLCAIRLGRRLRFEPFSKMSENFLTACEKERSFDIFIDGHKSISRYVALKAGEFPLRGVIHLVRDPRAFAASAKRVAHIPVHTAARQWIKLHGLIDSVTRWGRERVYTLRYEDLCDNPIEELTRLQNWLGASPETLLRPVDRHLHWLGNGSLRGFTGDIRNSAKWKLELTGKERSCVEHVTARFAAVYHYDFDKSVFQTSATRSATAERGSQSF